MVKIKFLDFNILNKSLLPQKCFFCRKGEWKVILKVLGSNENNTLD